MKIIDNGMVSMQWNADCFYESRSKGFMGAVNRYDGSRGELPVLFHERKAYLLTNDEGDILEEDEIAMALKELLEADDLIEDYYEGNCIVLADMAGVDEQLVSKYGLKEFSDDIEKRLADLSGYWEEVETDAF